MYNVGSYRIGTLLRTLAQNIVITFWEIKRRRSPFEFKSIYVLSESGQDEGKDKSVIQQRSSLSHLSNFHINFRSWLMCANVLQARSFALHLLNYFGNSLSFSVGVSLQWWLETRRHLVSQWPLKESDWRFCFNWKEGTERSGWRCGNVIII